MPIAIRRHRLSKAHQSHSDWSYAMPVIQINRSSKRRWLLLATFLGIIAAGGGSYWFWPQTQSPGSSRASTRAATPVTVAVVSRRDVPIYVSGLGTVQASNTVKIASQVDGKLERVLFTEGQHVEKGDLLAKIDPRPYQAALDQAKAKKDQDAALLVAAEKDLIRSQTLALKNYQSQQVVDQQQAKVDQLKASIAADQAAIENAQTQLDYTNIVAPIGGRIGMRLVDPGNLLRASDAAAITGLVATRPAAVVFTLPARVLPDIRDASARGPVEVVAFDQDNRGQLATGTLLLIDNAIDQATATVRLKAMFANEDEALWPGSFVNARVRLETRPNALVVPATAVQRGPQGLFTWIVTDGNVAQPRTIQVEATSGNLTIVVSGVAEGERVVTDGQYKLQSNAPVSITSTQVAASGDSP
jgi:membrane fusion protein, multidrug efflux system